MNTTEFTEKYMALLQPLEAIVAGCYHKYPDITDYDILQVYEALSKLIKAKQTNFPLPQHKLTITFADLYNHLLEFLNNQPYSLQEIQDCLKLLIKSVNRWTSRHGSQGYLTFISRFF